MKVIKANAGTDILSVFKKISDSIFNAFNKLVDLGLSVDKVKEQDDGSIITEITTGGGKKFKVKISPVGADTLKDAEECNIDIKTQEGVVKNYKNVANKNEAIRSKITEFVDATYEEAVEDFGDISSATDTPHSMKVVLQRVQSASEDGVNLTAILADYDAASALADLSAVVNDDTFLATVPADQAVAYEIVDTGDDYSISECGTFSTNTCFIEMLRSAFALMFSIQAIHWNGRGEDFKELHDKTDCLIWPIRNQIDCIAELCMEYVDHVPNPASFCCCGDVVSCDEGFTAMVGFAELQQAILRHVTTLELYYCNMSKDVQGLLDSWIREWKHEANYLLKRTLM